MPPPRALPEELIEEILLRFPSSEPARLVRAALVCKSWCRLVSGPGFRRRFREFHRTPPMLGLLLNIHADRGASGVSRSRFVPTVAFCLPHAEIRSRRVLDARHGRVLLQRQPEDRNSVDLLVWDPVTKEKREVPSPSPKPSRGLLCFAAAVLCSVTTGACDHLDCHRGPFLVVLVVVDDPQAMDSYLCTYSSESATWSRLVSVGFISSAAGMPSVCVGSALHFGFAFSNTILKYGLQSGQISRMEFPTRYKKHERKVFTTTEGGELGIATIRNYKLYIWSREDTRYSSRWIRARVIKLERLLPVDAFLGSAEPYVAGFADRNGVFFLWANNVLYTVNVETCKEKKLYEGHNIYNVVPYMSFYTPGVLVHLRLALGFTIFRTTIRMPGCFGSSFYRRGAKYRWLKCMNNYDEVCKFGKLRCPSESSSKGKLGGRLVIMVNNLRAMMRQHLLHP